MTEQDAEVPLRGKPNTAGAENPVLEARRFVEKGAGRLPISRGRGTEQCRFKMRDVSAADNRRTSSPASSRGTSDVIGLRLYVDPLQLERHWKLESTNKYTLQVLA